MPFVATETHTNFIYEHELTVSKRRFPKVAQARQWLLKRFQATYDDCAQRRKDYLESMGDRDSKELTLTDFVGDRYAMRRLQRFKKGETTWFHAKDPNITYKVEKA